MNRQQAATILHALESATDGNWPNTATRLTQQYGYKPEEIIKAWIQLEEMAGVNGTAPREEDF